VNSKLVHGTGILRADRKPSITPEPGALTGDTAG
jgi:hypothetical protein